MIFANYPVRKLCIALGMLACLPIAHSTTATLAPVSTQPTRPVREGPLAGYTEADLRPLFEAGNYVALDAKLERLQTLYRANQVDDWTVLIAYRSFYKTDPADAQRYAQWIQHFPTSYPAHVAEGIYYVYRGREARGTAYASQTSKAQFAGMYANYAKALADLDLATREEVKPVLAYAKLVDLSRYYPHTSTPWNFLPNAGARFYYWLNPEDKRPISQTLDEPELLAAANRLDPFNYSARVQHMQNLSGRWGGSHAQMQVFLEQCRSAGLTEAQLRSLQAMVVRDQAWKLEQEKNNAEAAQAYVQAAQMAKSAPVYLAKDTYTSLLYGAAVAFSNSDQCDKAQGYFVELLQTYPTNSDDWMRLGWCQNALGHSADAADSARRAAQFGNADEINDLGERIWHGTGLPKDQKFALSLFEKAADQGNAKAKENLYWARQQIGH